MIQIVFLDKSTIGNVPNLKRFEEFGSVTLYETTSSGEVIGRVRQAEIIITNKVIIDKNVLDHAPALKLICISATGMNNVDLEYAAGKGIPVKNVAGYSTNSVAQSTFSMILYLLGHLRYYDDYVRSGSYAESPIFTHMGPSFSELNGKIFGIIGLGTIGKKVAGIATAFGSEVIYYSTSGRNDNRDYKRVELDELLKTSDFVSIHAPLNERTKNLLNKNNLGQMKPSSILINAGRGGIVNESDLVDALNDDLISAAGLDVLEKEPIAAMSPFLKIKNRERLLIMPHVAWASIEARTLLVDMIYENIRNFMNGK
jgi:lactate dehydrogenase-like 2-hydroxyacid dehydrogenase